MALPNDVQSDAQSVLGSVMPAASVVRALMISTMLFANRSGVTGRPLDAGKAAVQTVSCGDLLATKQDTDIRHYDCHSGSGLSGIHS